jgi:hypothetical protein
MRADYYFSAKLINCFAHGAAPFYSTDTWHHCEKFKGVVPIYWGAPSIADFFNISGMIVFDTLQQVRLARIPASLRGLNVIFPALFAVAVGRYCGWAEC